MYCKKCELKFADKEFDNAYGDKCYICYLKSKGFYASAIRTINSNAEWWCYGKCKLLPIGWSFIKQIYIIGMFLAVLKSPVLNKTPKTKKTLTDYFTQWQIDIARGD